MGGGGVELFVVVFKAGRSRRTNAWPNACNLLCPTMLRSVVLKRCDRLAGACKCWAKNVRIFFVEVLRSFGQGQYSRTKLNCLPRLELTEEPSCQVFNFSQRFKILLEYF